ncbi:4236_t:CDS:2 [Ambispora leptoticha]|uniref:4236_t:CDS:1 n=1 Tax=Ambispora leptoticha TaxID=144679 RepID=A0A9N8ZXE6_9GLOM|nr:4236_t:CDS:2 [Ambispora leptoticha]
MVYRASPPVKLATKASISSQIQQSNNTSQRVIFTQAQQQSNQQRRPQPLQLNPIPAQQLYVSNVQPNPHIQPEETHINPLYNEMANQFVKGEINIICQEQYFSDL